MQFRRINHSVAKSRPTVLQGYKLLIDERRKPMHESRLHRDSKSIELTRHLFGDQFDSGPLQFGYFCKITRGENAGDCRDLFADYISEYLKTLMAIPKNAEGETLARSIQSYVFAFPSNSRPSIHTLYFELRIPGRSSLIIGPVLSQDLWLEASMSLQDIESILLFLWEAFDVQPQYFLGDQELTISQLHLMLTGRQSAANALPA